MTQAQSAEEKARVKKQWTDLAIQQALSSQWEEAVITNKNILGMFPNEPEAYNRLGKAYSELGQYAESRQAYAQTLKYNPTNTIARKNLERLSLLQEEPVQVHAGVERIDPRLFIEETGKIEPRLANRLINFMEGGNRYAAAILAMENGQVRLIIREDYQHPSMFGKVSFPSQGGVVAERAYIKDSMLRYDREDDDELGSDDEYYDGGDDSDDMTEIDLESGIEGEE